MGKGGAQLGKSLKGKSKDRPETAAEKKSEAETKEVQESITQSQIDEDAKQLQEYERLAKLTEAHRARLKKLAQEEAYNTRINSIILQNLQRRLMRDEKLESLKRDLDLLATQHQQQVERKDATLHMLSQDLDDVSQQFEQAQRTHMAKVDTLVRMHNARLRQLETECERDLKALRTEFETERDDILAQHGRQVRELTSIIESVETEERRRSDEARQAHETEREEIRNKNLEDINMLRIHLENKIDDLERQFDEAHQNYVLHTDQANKQFKKLVKKDKTLTKQIEAQKNKISRCQARLAQWKKTLAHSEKEHREKLQGLRQQKESITKQSQELEHRIKRARTEETHNLSELTSWSRDTLKANQAKLSQAENILLLAEQSHKLETERETVVPFGKELSALGISEDSLHAAAQEMEALRSQGEPTSYTVEQWELLVNFYKRYNKALLDKLAVQQEKQRLVAENADLRLLVKQYLDGIKVHEDTVDTPNPLLIVNGRVNIVPDQRQQVKKKPVVHNTVEAAITVRTYAAHHRAVR